MSLTTPLTGRAVEEAFEEAALAPLITCPEKLNPICYTNPLVLVPEAAVGLGGPVTVPTAVAPKS